MIPKVIHYCWFGNNEKPKIVLDCIESWKKYCPDFEIKEWNETNFNIEKYNYTKQAYYAKKYAFVSDVARFEILFENGGIYLDTDVELIKPINSFLDKRIFLPYSQNGLVSTGLIMGSEPNNPFLKKVIEYYKNTNFLLNNGRPNTTTVCTIITDILIYNGYHLDKKTKEEKGIQFYSWEYFDPYNPEKKSLQIRDETVSIHHYVASWKSNKDIIIYKIGLVIKHIVGEQLYKKIAVFKHKIIG